MHLPGFKLLSLSHGNSWQQKLPRLLGIGCGWHDILQPAWMENLASTLIWGGESNCSWSVVYVCVIGETIKRKQLVLFMFFRWRPFCSRIPFLLLDLLQKVEGWFFLCSQNPQTLLPPPHLRAWSRADQRHAQPGHRRDRRRRQRGGGCLPDCQEGPQTHQRDPDGQRDGLTDWQQL